jgi:hypothetical protein
MSAEGHSEAEQSNMIILQSNSTPEELAQMGPELQKMLDSGRLIIVSCLKGDRPVPIPAFDFSAGKITYQRHPLDPVHQCPDVSDGDTIRKTHTNIGRNALCPCGSGKKFKKCCNIKDDVPAA